MELQIHLSIDAAGNVGLKVAGADSGNKVALLGLLEFAKAAIAAPEQPQQETKVPILVANGPLPAGHRLNGR